MRYTGLSYHQPKIRICFQIKKQKLFTNFFFHTKCMEHILVAPRLYNYVGEFYMQFYISVEQIVGPIVTHKKNYMSVSCAWSLEGSWGMMWRIGMVYYWRQCKPTLTIIFIDSLVYILTVLYFLTWTSL